MKIFTPIYQKTLKMASHRQAPFYLGFVSFIEAIFFPIPPDVMLMPMAISKPKQALRFAIIATIWSTLGGIVGYGIGLYFSQWATHLITVTFGYAKAWQQVLTWFDKWGILIVFVAGFTPVPYKVITICTGVTHLSFIPFVLSAMVSRFLRFWLVAQLSAWGGNKFADKINRFMEWIGWTVIILAVALVLIFK